MKIPIAFKLITITLTLIIAAAVPIAQKSASLFENVSRQREEDSNRAQAEARATEIESIITNLLDNIKTISALILNEQGKEIKDTAELAFKNDKDIVAIEMKQVIDGRLESIRKLVKQEYFKAYNLKEDYLIRLRNKQYFNIKELLSGKILINNSSDPQGAPLFTIQVPVAKDKNGNISHLAIVDYKLARLQKSFSTRSERDIFLIDKNGIIMAHPNESKSVSKESIKDGPIYSKIIESEVPKGQLKYKDPEDNKKYIGAYAKTPYGLTVISQVSEDVILEPARLVKRQAYFITFLILSGALFFVFIFSMTISSPIEKLVSLTKRISKGDFNFKAKYIVKANDEVGELAKSFDGMLDGLKERDKVKSLFNKFHGSSIAEDLIKNDIAVGGKNKMVTVFFSDIRGFTKFSEKRTPEEVVEMLNEYFKVMVAIITKHKGIVDKFIGDAIMAVWGAPTSHPKDAHNAVKACIEMRRALDELNQKRIARGHEPIRIGMGLHSGKAISGTIGSEERMEYTVIGDTVNMASRIEASTKAFGTDLLISQETQIIIGDDFLVEEAGAAEVKGKSEPIKLYKVFGYKDESGMFVEVVTDYSEYDPEHADKVKIAA